MGLSKIKIVGFLNMIFRKWCTYKRSFWVVCMYRLILGHSGRNVIGYCEVKIFALWCQIFLGKNTSWKILHSVNFKFYFHTLTHCNNENVIRISEFTVIIHAILFYGPTTKFLGPYSFILIHHSVILSFLNGQLYRLFF